MTEYRFYFNRAAEAPQIWSVDEGAVGTEIDVQGIELLDVEASSVWDPDAGDGQGERGHDIHTPRAYFKVRGAELVIHNGKAWFFPEDYLEEYREMIYG